MEQFRAICVVVGIKPLKLIMHVPTHWNSVFKMLERALFLHKAVDAFIAQNKQFKKFAMSKSEWDQAEFILNILLPFNACSNRLEQLTHVGINQSY